MRIVYTYHGISQKVSGGSRYYFEIAKRLRMYNKVYIVMLFNTNEYFKTIIKRLPFPICFEANRWLCRIKAILEEINTFIQLNLLKYDIVHITNDNSKSLPWIKTPFVITIHDLISEMFFTKDSIWHQERSKLIHAADHIICVSNNTKKDLLRIYPDISDSKVSVIYHGYNKYNSVYVRQNDFRYILYVGSRLNTYKNFDGMLKAIQPILKNKGLKLICTGATFNKEEIRLITNLGLQDYIMNKGYVTDSDLANLYHFAEVFVYPSKYEGFGMPILEAYEHECPICISNASCFPEIAGDAAEYFDPNSESSMRKSILHVLENREYAKELVEKGKLRQKKFSWGQSAKMTFEIYKKVLNAYGK